MSFNPNLERNQNLRREKSLCDIATPQLDYKGINVDIRTRLYSTCTMAS